MGTLFSWITKNRKMKKVENCPNCWGRQEYEGHFYDASKKDKIDLNNISQKRGWIQAYVVKYFEGMKKKVAVSADDECPSCSLSYREMV
ncbi:MAG: hypothetical protein H6604_03125 [Flavobacteriales bacterium]|nr:hypothetical protein [Flavobacteriales bacterium]